MRDGEVVGRIADMEDQGLLCQQFTDAAVDFIRRNKDGPFFVYLPHAFIHHPRGARREFLGLEEGEQIDWDSVIREPWDFEVERRTRAQIEEVDWSVGRILDTLRELELAGDTLVLFTSDNGASRGSVNTPLRGGKGSTWEGGMREPTLAWWPGHVSAGTVVDEMATTMDLMPTLAGLAGSQAPAERIIDGKDISALLLGEEGARSPHEAFYYYAGYELRAVRSGQWKLDAKDGGALRSGSGHRGDDRRRGGKPRRGGAVVGVSRRRPRGAGRWSGQLPELPPGGGGGEPADFVAAGEGLRIQD